MRSFAVALSVSLAVCFLETSEHDHSVKRLMDKNFDLRIES